MELEGWSDELLFGDSAEAAVPPPVRASAAVLDMSFHPQLPLLAVGLVTGELEVYEYDRTSYEMTKKPLRNEFAEWVFGRGRLYSEHDVVVSYHEHALRVHPSGGVTALEFTDDGSYLVSASSDRTVSVVDCATSRLLIHLAADETMAAARARLSSATSKKKKKTTAVTAKRLTRQHGETAMASAEVVAHTDDDDNNDNGSDDGGGILVGATRVRREGTTTLLRTRRGSARVKSKRGKTSAAATAAVVARNPHKYGISALNVCDANLVATGDDDGLIAVWDMRARRTAHVYHEHGDYVTQLCYFTDAQELVSSSGDTCLAVYDMRAGTLRDVSERRSDELTCFAFINSSGAGNASFIPSILCGTPSGSLPLWKYGSWRRPYDVIDRHPRECEALVSFHADDTAFNHNLVLTGAADGLVRVVQMYPLRRNLCQLSARDHDYGHHYYQHSSGNGSSTATASSGGGGEDAAGGERGRQRRLLQQQQGGGGGGGLTSRARRGDAGIARMRVSFDCNVLAVSGSDDMIDFVDIRFLNDEKQLDELRNRAEQRHMHVIRVMERDKADEAAAREAEAAADDSSSSSDDDDDDSSSNDEDDSGKPTAAEEAMAAYRLSRAQKRERVAAAKWLKEEKRKKINFTFEKRRRRVGGFFGDMVAHDDADE